MIALYLLAAIVAVGAALYIEHRLYLRRHAGDKTADTPTGDTPAATDDECCGMHITCERDSLLASVSTEIEYFDDEELDRHANREPDTYDPSDIEEFRDILLSMQPTDIAPWARSLQLRHIALPQEIRDEIIMIVAEARSAATANA